jgi:hypothetical protein
MGSMTAQAPPTWLEDLATADTGRGFDAMGSSEGSLFGSNFHNLDNRRARMSPVP